MSLSSPEPVQGSRDPASKRRQIIDGAAAVFNELGYDGASMSRIAEEATVSKGTLYNYFTSKSELFGAVVEEQARENRARIMGDVRGDEGEDVGRALHGIAVRIVQTLLAKPTQTLYRIVLSEAGKFPHLAEIYYEAGHRRGVQELAGWLRARTERGQLAIEDFDLAAEQFASLCRTKLFMLRCFNIGGSATDEEIEAIVACNVEMFLNTYAPDRRP